MVPIRSLGDFRKCLVVLANLGLRLHSRAARAYTSCSSSRAGWERCGDSSLCWGVSDDVDPPECFQPVARNRDPTQKVSTFVGKLKGIAEFWGKRVFSTIFSCACVCALLVAESQPASVIFFSQPWRMARTLEHSASVWDGRLVDMVTTTLVSFGEMRFVISARVSWTFRF